MEEKDVSSVIKFCAKISGLWVGADVFGESVLTWFTKRFRWQKLEKQPWDDGCQKQLFLWQMFFFIKIIFLQKFNKQTFCKKIA